LARYRFNDETLGWARPDAIFMHCLPGFRGEEMTDGVFGGPLSAIFGGGEIMMRTEKAMLSLVVA
jgi:ornithine carbamoyltransferase